MAEPSPPLAVPAVALGIGAHPDDIEFGAGATLAKWARAGTVVHLVICTDGSKGTWDPDADIAALVARREIESVDAARALGATGEVVHLRQIDGELGSGLDMRAAVAREIRRLRPDVVLGHDPWKRYRLHPDHRYAGLLAVEGIVAARDPFFFPEQGLAPHRPEALLLFEADEENHAEPVTAVDVEARVAALLAHRSQLETTHFHRLDDPTTAHDGFRQRESALLAAAGEPFGLALAETFHLMDDL